MTEDTKSPAYLWARDQAAKRAANPSYKDRYKALRSKILRAQSTNAFLDIRAELLREAGL